MHRAVPSVLVVLAVGLVACGSPGDRTVDAPTTTTTEPTSATSPAAPTRTTTIPTSATATAAPTRTTTEPTNATSPATSGRASPSPQLDAAQQAGSKTTIPSRPPAPCPATTATDRVRSQGYRRRVDPGRPGRSCVVDALQITRPRRRPKASSATSMTPPTPLQITVVGSRFSLMKRASDIVPPIMRIIRDDDVSSNYRSSRSLTRATRIARSQYRR
jgi:hypothetical protein